MKTSEKQKTMKGMREFLTFSALVVFAAGAISCSKDDGGIEIQNDFTELEGQYYVVMGEQMLFFRAEPDMNSPITDSVVTVDKYPRNGEPMYKTDFEGRPIVDESGYRVTNFDLGFYAERRFIVADGAPEGWRKVGLEIVHASLNRYDNVEIEQVGRVLRYVDEESFNRYTVGEYEIKNDSAKIAIYSAPDLGAPTGDSISSAWNDRDILPGWFNAHKSDTDGWYKLAVREEYVFYRNPQKTFGARYPYYTTSSLYVTQKDLEENATPFMITIERELTREDAGKIPKWILWLTLSCIVFLPMNRIRIFVLLPLLTAVFAMELYYFMVLEEDFWWCSFDTVGWFKAILLFLLSLGVIYMQFRMYFAVIADIKEMSRPFNTAVGTTIYAAFIIGALIYAIFAGEIENKLLIILSLVFLVIQEIITIVALRRNPVAMLVTLIFLPLGMFALVITSLKFFAVLALFTIVGLVFYAWARSGSNATGGGSGGNRGMSEGCPYRNGDYCTFGGHNHACNLRNGGGHCQHGQR